jgi:hypothetical protein
LGRSGLPVHKGQPAPKGQPDRKAPKVLKDLLALKVHREHKDHLGLLVRVTHIRHHAYCHPVPP